MPARDSSEFGVERLLAICRSWALFTFCGARTASPARTERARPFLAMEEVTQPRVYVWTCVALLALLALTWAIAYVDLGPFNLIAALAVAIAKAIIIALFFMHIKGSSRLLHLAAVAGVIWLLFLISLTLGDYSTRGWVPLNH
jgi:cytochrome c oxidase subunit IV